MARKARLIIPGVPLHVMVKGLPNLAIFPNDESKLTYLAWLRDAAREYQLAIHAYVLLPTQLNLLVTPKSTESLSRTMQSLGRRYTQYFNQHHQKEGSIWAGRYKSSIVDPQNYLLNCQKFIELMPVVEGLVTKPEDYLWSSYRIHVGKEPNYGLTDAPSFWNLGNTPFERQMNWKNFIDEGLTAKETEVITHSISSQGITGTSDFLTSASTKVLTYVAPKRRGRPKKVQ